MFKDFNLNMDFLNLKMNKEDMYKWMTIALLVIIGLMIIFGCSCKKEGFESSADADAAKKKDEDHKEVKKEVKKDEKKSEAPLTVKETEMFEKLVKEEFSPTEIQNLIKEGFLTEKLVERFMEELKANPPNKKDEKPEVEAFYGGSPMAKW